MRILAMADLHGAIEVLDKLKEACKIVSPELLVFSGDIVRGKARGDEWLAARSEKRMPNKEKEDIHKEEREDIGIYRHFYSFLNALNIPVMLVPGNMDAPAELYFRLVLEFVSLYKKLRCVQGRHWHFLRNFIIAGFGGEITKREREEFFVQQYPRWQVEYDLSDLRYEEQEKILIFHTPPLGSLDLEEGGHKGNETVNEIIKTLNPHLVFCGHAHKARGEEWIGDTLVVNPGALKYGYYAVVDTMNRRVDLRNL